MSLSIKNEITILKLSTCINVLFAAAGFIFILTGLSPDPQVDIPAHFGGFLGGILAGIILNRLPSSYLHHTLTNVILTIFWFTLCSFCWWIAIEK